MFSNGHLHGHSGFLVGQVTGELAGYLIVGVFLVMLGVLAALSGLIGHGVRRARGTTPVLAQEQARVVGLREANPNGYYVTFAMPHGAQLEFQIWGAEFGRLAEGDTGLLTYRGDSYQSFEPEPR